MVRGAAVCGSGVWFVLEMNGGGYMFHTIRHPTQTQKRPKTAAAGQGPLAMMSRSRTGLRLRNQETNQQFVGVDVRRAQAKSSASKYATHGYHAPKTPAATLVGTQQAASIRNLVKPAKQKTAKPNPFTLFTTASQSFSFSDQLKIRPLVKEERSDVRVKTDKRAHQGVFAPRQVPRPKSSHSRTVLSAKFLGATNFGDPQMRP
eukprot:Platyproteum_vivax@DN4520_c0_g1_i1.p1